MRQSWHERNGAFTRLVMAGAAVLLVLGAVVAWMAMRAPEMIESRLAEDADVRAVAIPIDGMACVVCAAGVRRHLAGVEGVEAVEVSLGDRRAVVQYRPGQVDPGALAERLKNTTGYRIGQPEPIED